MINLCNRLHWFLLFGLLIISPQVLAQGSVIGQPGIGVDSHGGPTIDPTKNVLDLVEAGAKAAAAIREADNRRQDDLRQAGDLLLTTKINALQAVVNAEIQRIDTEASLRAEFAQQLATAEAKRIDAIRAVDVNAVTVASQKSADSASVLAAQVAASAEALRTLVATTAAATATSLQQTITPIATRLAAIEQAQYQATGAKTFSDPALIQLTAEVRALSQSNNQNAGKTEGISASWAVFIAAVSAMIGVGSILVVVFNNNNRSRIEEEKRR